jgi:hypothetical protein
LLKYRTCSGKTELIQVEGEQDEKNDQTLSLQNGRMQDLLKKERSSCNIPILLLEMFVIKTVKYSAWIFYFCYTNTMG